MSIIREIVNNILLNRLDERVSYKYPHIDEYTKDAQVYVYYNPKKDRDTEYILIKQKVVKEVRKKNPKLKCNSYQSQSRLISSNKVELIFYFSI